MRSTILPVVRWLGRKTVDPDQLQSPFFRILPLEIRQIIYAYAVVYSYVRECDTSKDVPDLHIVTMKKDGKSRLTSLFKGRLVLCHSRCKQLNAPCKPQCWLVSTCWESKFGDWSLLSVALTCRRMYEYYSIKLTPTNLAIRYTESLPYLYTQQTFRFGSLPTLTRFASTIPSVHFRSSIRRLCLDWSFSEVLVTSHGSAYTEISDAPFEESGWDEVCDEVLLKMRGLRELRVRFIRDDWTKEVVWERRIFDGVKRVAEGKGMRKGSENPELRLFEVDLNWLGEVDTILEVEVEYPGVNVTTSSGLKRSEFIGGALSRRVE